jgi:hypothetical protein
LLLHLATPAPPAKLLFPKAKLGKLHSIEIHPAKNGAVVTHHFKGVPSRKFVFHDPATMKAHITRALKSEWRHPDVNLSAKIESTLNV